MFKKNVLAVCIASAVISTATMGSAIAQNTTEFKSSFSGNTQDVTQYIIYLNDQPAINNFNLGKQNYLVEKNKVIAAQQALFAQVLALDPMAKLINSSSLLANFITVSVTDEYTDKLSSLPGVASVNKANTRQIVKTLSKVSNTTVLSDTNSEEQVQALEPYNNDANAGGGVDIAIISTGVDYTLEFFGGSGEYGDDGDPETPPMVGSYLDALENGPLSPSIPAIEDDPSTPEDESQEGVDGFDGFPTNVIVGGYDFAGENYGEDGNPIDQNYNFTSWNGWEYPTGMGTEIASIIHQLAPGAKLHAYKISNLQPSAWDANSFDYIMPDPARVIKALEHALDPNQDGDTSDHLDIALIDAGGSAAFSSPFGQGGVGSSSASQLIIERASALGLTIVTHAGDLAKYSLVGDAEQKLRNWISNEGGATSAITVGSVVTSADSDDILVADWSPIGPVRGSKELKPEIVSYANDVPVAKISNPDENANKMGSRTDALSAAARIAAAAAVVKSSNPGLGSIEIKALLANTASVEGILEKEGGSAAELLLVGHGIENVEAAVNSPIAIWEKSSYQPYIQFGAHEVSQQKRVFKTLTLRNFSNSAQTYTASYKTNGEKAGYDALNISFPETVSVPANMSVNVLVEITIDGTKLPEWPLQSTPDYTDENLKATELNGYITFASAGLPDLNLGWMVSARNETTIDKQVITTEYPQYKGFNTETGETEWDSMDWANTAYPVNEWGYPGYIAHTSTFINDSLTPTTFEAYPILIHNPNEPVGKENVSGHKIKAVGGGIYDDARCDITGKKMSIAVNLFQPADVALANYMDKIGPPIFYYDLHHEQVVLDFGWNESFGGAAFLDDSQQINQPFVQLNAKGQPATYYIDYNKTFDYTNPNGRYTESKLPVRFTNDGTNIVSEMCIEEFFHHELDSVEDFDQNLGFHIETDRDAGIEKYQPLTQFNPLKGGYYSNSYQCTISMFGEVCGDILVDRSTRIGFAKLAEDQSINDADFQHTITAQPGEKITIAAARNGELNNNNHEFMVLSSSDNFFQLGTVGFIDYDGSVLADVRAGQSFTLNEDALADTVVGLIKLDTNGFFAGGDQDWQSHDLHIVNSLPGSPFAINQDTHELYVSNPDALDFENQSMYQVQVMTQQGNTLGNPRLISVYLNNVNDIAPVVVADTLNAIGTIEMIIDKNGENFSLDFSGLFAESEGNALTYSVEADGITSLAISDTQVSGMVSEAGEYQIMITASDGLHQVTAMVPVSATKKSSSSSGSFGFLSLLAGLIIFRFRK